MGCVSSSPSPDDERQAVPSTGTRAAAQPKGPPATSSTAQLQKQQQQMAGYAAPTAVADAKPEAVHLQVQANKAPQVPPRQAALQNGSARKVVKPSNDTNSNVQDTFVKVRGA